MPARNRRPVPSNPFLTPPVARLCSTHGLGIMAAELQGDWLELATASGSTIRVLKAAHPRARRLRLTVTPKGARVSYPNGTHPSQVSAFLRSHADWLEKKLDELNLIVKPLPALRVGHATEFPLRGEIALLD